MDFRSPQVEPIISGQQQTRKQGLDSSVSGSDLTSALVSGKTANLACPHLLTHGGGDKDSR